MKRNSILALTLAAVIIATTLILSGCGKSNNTANNTTNNTTSSQDADKDGVKDSEENNTNELEKATHNIGDNIRNTSDRVGEDIAFTAINFKDAIVNAGYDVKESLDTHRDYFKGTETDYLVGNDLVRIYEYDTPEAIDEDISTISGDGTVINGTTVEYTNTPRYYRKGNTLIVYDGNDQEYINHLNTLYGNPIVPAS